MILRPWLVQSELDKYVMKIAEITAQYLVVEGVTEIDRVPAWVDPSRAQLMALSKKIPLRGTIVDGHIYVWNAEDETHYGIHRILVSYEEDYAGDYDFMIAPPDDMQDYINGKEVEISPGVFLNGNAGALAHPVIRSLRPKIKN